MSKSISRVTDPLVLKKLGEYTIGERTQGLVENIIHFYGFEICPVSSTEVALRCCMLVDPQIAVIPDWLINYASKQFGEDMINKMLQFSQNFKGTQYEEKLKASENAEFYNWIKKYIIEYCDKKGWSYEFPEF